MPVQPLGKTHRFRVAVIGPQVASIGVVKLFLDEGFGQFPLNHQFLPAVDQVLQDALLKPLLVLPGHTPGSPAVSGRSAQRRRASRRIPARCRCDECVEALFLDVFQMEFGVHPVGSLLLSGATTATVTEIQDAANL